MTVSTDGIRSPHVPDLATRALEAAHEFFEFLTRFYARTRSSTCPVCEYSPEVIRYYIRTWEQSIITPFLGMAASTFNPITGGSKDRNKILAIKADLERATDATVLTCPYLHWSIAYFVYKRQERLPLLLTQRRIHSMAHLPRLPHVDPFPHEPPQFAVAYAILIERIARHLGWVPHDCEKPT